ncbi:TetR/AcrR family transcriptional regulator [Novosphingobium sp.]|uniref:TetR/AcrR family transcriptional regulator n=1 Tax=Novosphingobium sp. TaxID=1874826 RepID=UPI0031D09DB2
MTKKPADSPSISSRRPNAERREESMTLILDHAEAEFAAKGYNGTTLASVAAIAGIDTSLMRYYFGDKEKLFAAVFRRRGPLINAARYKALDAYRQEFGDRGTLEGLIDAFVRPGFDMAQESDGHRNYAAIVAYVNSSRGAMHSLMSEVFDDVSKVLIADMQRLMPNAPLASLYWGYHFLTGAFTFSLGQTGRIDRISDGEVSSSDFAGIADRLPAFVAAGIRALCNVSQGPEQEFGNTL